MSEDYVLNALSPLHLRLLQAMGDSGPPSFLARCGFALLLFLQLAAVAGAVCSLLDRLTNRRERLGAWNRGVVTGGLAVALFAFGLLNWILHHPSNSIIGTTGRWDYWLLCAFGGHLFSFLGHTTQKWSLVGLSLVFLGHYLGTPALAIVGGGIMVGWVAIHRNPHRPAPSEAAIQGTLLIGLLGYLGVVLRATDPQVAMQTWGLACWVFMRHISFVVEARRGCSTRLVDYLTYQTFLPTCIGVMEVYDEFAVRNLQSPGRPDRRSALIGVLRGHFLMTIALLLPVTHNAWMDATTFTGAWWGSLTSLLRSGLFLTGSWYMIEAAATLLGYGLRPNFRGVLTATNPSQFWRAWRGTMTNWLVRYVYIPLGGNRRHPTWNILAAFVVSMLWHMGGLPFVHPSDMTLGSLAPIATWGILNFLGVAIHARWRRRWPAGTWIAPANPLNHAIKIFLTACFGTLTVTVLGYPFERAAGFVPFMRLLLGLTAIPNW